MHPVWTLAICLLLTACSTMYVGPTHLAARHRKSQRLKVLTYNVAGLPQWLSRSKPRRNLPRIGELMNGYDLVLAQEDFAYPRALRRKSRFRQQSRGKSRRRFVFDLGDGLSRFANHRFEGHTRETWSKCHGRLRHASDCLADKGFTVATHEITEGAYLDVYNVHFDAGHSRGDIRAREAQVLQLARHIRLHSVGHAVLIGGDTNFYKRTDKKNLRRLLRLTGTRDACLELGCKHPDRIDRVLIRSSDQLELTAVKWRIDKRFVSSSGEDLSDHKPVAVTLDVRPVQRVQGVATR